MQKTGKIRLPEGKKVAVSLGMDFDAQAIWDGSFSLLSPAYMSRGEFGAEVAAGRILDLLDKYDLKITWFVPGHTADTFPDICKEILRRGHEIGHHGYVHENPTNLPYDQEKKVMEMGLESLAKIGAPKPTVYRSPYWDFSPNTLRILEEYGFKYDSSLMGNDLFPYYPRPVECHSDSANIFGEPSKILELPVSWFLDDWPQTEYLTGGQEGQRPAKDIYDRWTSIFDYAHDKLDGACYMLTCHPQTTGRAYMIQMYEELIQYFMRKDAWFATASEVGDSFVPNS